MAKALPLDAEMIAGGVLILGFAMWWISQKGNAANVGAAAGSAAANLAGGVVAGAATTIGSAVGIPQTNTDQCTADLAAGNTWAASFSCPASRFISSLFGSSSSSSSSSNNSTAPAAVPANSIPPDFGIINAQAGW